MPSLVLVVCLTLLFVFGAIFGSFACCQAYRIRYRNLGKKISNRSECLHCGHKLEWSELIPIISWMILKGRCRECKKPIGKIELWSEIGMGMVFLFLGLKFLKDLGGWERGELMLNTEIMQKINQETLLVMIMRYGLLLAITVMFWTLLVYDLKWQELPKGILYTVIILTVIYFLIGEMGRLGVISEGSFEKIGRRVASERGSLSSLQIMTNLKRDMWTFGESLIILPLLYFLLYKISDEKLVGGGDYLVGLAISCLLWRFELVMFVLFLSNFLAFVINFRSIFSKNKKRIAFGPYLIIAFFIVFFFAEQVMRYFYVIM